MLCAYPVPLAGMKRPVPCGRCNNCRVNRKLFWVGRLLMEWDHTELPTWFVTLTYDDEHVPVAWNGLENQLTLDPSDFRNWLMRWRKTWGRIRFFGVGEYGDRTHRPHYHVIIFGEPEDDIEERVVRSWKLDGKVIGFTAVAEMNEARAKYVAQYTVKKLTHQHGALGARYPEFARMSRKPPLGWKGYMRMAEQLMTEQGSRYMVERNGIVPQTFRRAGRQYPIGRYFRELLGEETGYEFKASQEDLPDDWEEQIERARAAEAKSRRRGPEKGTL